MKSAPLILALAFSIGSIAYTSAGTETENKQQKTHAKKTRVPLNVTPTFTLSSCKETANQESTGKLFWQMFSQMSPEARVQFFQQMGVLQPALTQSTEDDQTDGYITDTLASWLTTLNYLGTETCEYTEHVASLFKQASNMVHFELALLSYTIIGYIQHPMLAQYAMSIAHATTPDEITSAAHSQATTLLINACQKAKDSLDYVTNNPLGEDPLALTLQTTSETTKDDLKTTVDLEEVVDVFNHSPKVAIQFIKQLLSQATAAEKSIIRKNLEQLSTENEEDTDGFSNCYKGAFKNIRLRRSERLRKKANKKVAATIKKTPPSVAPKPRKGMMITEVIADGNPQGAHMMAQELAQVVKLIKQHNILNLEQGVIPSQMTIDQQIKQRRANWQAVKVTSEAALQHSRKSVSKRKKAQHEQWAQEKETSSVNYQEILEENYRNAQRECQQTFHAEAPESHRVKDYVKAQKLILSLDLTHNRITATTKAQEAKPTQ